MLCSVVTVGSVARYLFREADSIPSVLNLTKSAAHLAPELNFMNSLSLALFESCANP
jgi:hypothetical protein